MLGRCRRRDAYPLALLLLGACGEPAHQWPSPSRSGGESAGGTGALEGPLSAGSAGEPPDSGGAVLSDDGFLTVTADAYRILIHPDRRSVALEVPAEEFEAYTSGRFATIVPPVAARLYRHFRDDFEFLLVVNNRAEKPVPSPVAGESTVVTNDVAGIGVEPGLNLAELRGLPPVAELEFVLYLPNFLALTNGPSLHELMHRWGNYLFEVTEAPGHWGFSSVGGQLGGWSDGTLAEVDDGNFQATNAAGGRFWPNSNGGNVVPYAPLELYLMGLVPAEAVPPLSFAVNPSWVDDSQGVFRADGFVTRTSAELAEIWGPRTPDPTLSPKRFRTLIALVTSPEATVDWDDWTARVADFVAERESDYLDEFGGGRLYNFWSATGGLASLDAGRVDAALR
jgi:hypothetical protein